MHFAERLFPCLLACLGRAVRSESFQERRCHALAGLLAVHDRVSWFSGVVCLLVGWFVCFNLEAVTLTLPEQPSRVPSQRLAERCVRACEREDEGELLATGRQRGPCIVLSRTKGQKAVGGPRPDSITISEGPRHPQSSARGGPFPSCNLRIKPHRYDERAGVQETSLNPE